MLRDLHACACTECTEADGTSDQLSGSVERLTVGCDFVLGEGRNKDC